MSQDILKQPIIASDEVGKMDETVSSWKTYLPFTIVIAGSFALLLLRINLGVDRFISDGALMMLALACYMTAAVFYLTNLYAPSDYADKLGSWGAGLGVFFNLSSWLVRWASAYDREFAIFQQQGKNIAEMPWIFRYIPFANLYDLSLAFAFGAGITTLLVIRRPQYKIVAALALPLAAIILVLARFIGDEFIDLPPVLDSYWRPIHVGIASISYGVALVCFAVAVLYLLKDNLKVQKMAIWASVFAISVFATISKFSIFSFSSFGTYTASTFVGDSRMSLALRADIPYVGWIIVLAAALLLGGCIAYAVHLSKDSGSARKYGAILMQASLVAQAAAIGVLIYQLKNLSNIISHIDPATQYEKFATWMLQQENVPAPEIAQMSSQQLYSIGSQWVQQNGANLHLSLNANPVELAALITAFTATFFVVLFSFKTETIRAALPSAEKLDSLMYKLAGVAFAGLALLLMTGAIWANESWGRYWGWDSKETGAFVAWLTYGAFLHSRIAFGWRGRRSAYFAILAFLFVIFTYLGVSYLLPGLHSYA